MPERIQLRRIKGWRKPENAIVVARPSRWGNPFPIAEYGVELSLILFENIAHGVWNPTPLDHLGDQPYQRAYERQRAWRARFHRHPLEVIRSELCGHDLACWCPLDQPCHADVLLEIANS